MMIRRNLTDFGRTGLGLALRQASSDAAGASTVLVSTSNDVILNLALEDWLYQKFDWTVRPSTVLLWRNSPCVVIGRHQNPWLECRLSSAASNGVTVARRNSGGGTVYHDLGNLNCTFFTSRTTYDRRANLELICKALVNRRPELDVRVSSRLDILLDDYYKVSGTASKLGRNAAYHHCTVLVDVDTNLLSRVLRMTDVDGVESKATRSVKSPVRNLQGLDMEDVTRSIADLYAHHLHRRHYSLIEPTEDRFPGITEIAHHLSSWEWIYGKCPPFTLQRTVRVPNELGGSVVFKANVLRGIVESVSIDGSNDLNSAVQPIVGSRFPLDNRWTTHASNDLSHWIAVSCFGDLL